MTKHNPLARSLVATELVKLRGISRNLNRMKSMCETSSPQRLVKTPLGNLTCLQILLVAEVTYEDGVKRVAQARRLQFEGMPLPRTETMLVANNE